MVTAIENRANSVNRVRTGSWPILGNPSRVFDEFSTTCVEQGTLSTSLDICGTLFARIIPSFEINFYFILVSFLLLFECLATLITSIQHARQGGALVCSHRLRNIFRSHRHIFTTLGNFEDFMRQGFSFSLISPRVPPVRFARVF